jgi:cupin fold WbuC family metalloprotein
MKDFITAERLDELVSAARRSERRRAHLNTHDSENAAVQRLFIATEPDTYMRPHRHPEAHKWEYFMVLEGHIDLLLFDDEGRLTQRTTMTPRSVRAVEVPPGTWHCYVCQASGTLAMEIKEGAYRPTEERDFAAWSPPERSGGAAAFREWLRLARPGDQYAEPG